MGFFRGPNIVLDYLTVSNDAASIRSYPGSGDDWYNIYPSPIDPTAIYGAVHNTNKGGAFGFDASNDYCVTGFGNGVDPSTDPFTIECVVQSNSTSSSRMFLATTSHADNTRCYFATNSGYWRMGIQNSGWGTGTIAVTTNPTHSAVSFDDGDAKMYVNGVFSHQKSYTSYELLSNLNIGRGNGYYWGGNIFLVHIYNAALSQIKILQNFNALKGRFGL